MKIKKIESNVGKEVKAEDIKKPVETEMELVYGKLSDRQLALKWAVDLFKSQNIEEFDDIIVGSIISTAYQFLVFLKEEGNQRL